jgi:hypothetical protein
VAFYRVQAAIDHLLWTESLATLVESLDGQAVADTARAKRLSLSGTISKKALAELTSRDWKVLQNVAHK